MNNHTNLYYYACMPVPMHYLASNLTTLRENSGLNITQFAASLKSSRATYRSYECGAHIPPLDFIYRTACIYHTSLHSLIACPPEHLHKKQRQINNLSPKQLTFCKLLHLLSYNDISSLLEFALLHMSHNQAPSIKRYKSGRTSSADALLYAGNIARSLRQSCDYTQCDVAMLINISRSTYSQFEIGKRLIPVDAFTKLCTLNNVSPDIFISHNTCGYVHENQLTIIFQLLDIFEQLNTNSQRKLLECAFQMHKMQP